MSIADKLTAVAENEQKVYDAGFKAGQAAGGGDITQNPMYYMSLGYGTWMSKAFPSGFNFVLNLRDKPSDLNAMLMRTSGIKTVTLICEAEGTTNYIQVMRECPAEMLDISNFKPTPTDISYFVYLAENLISILGELDLSSCTKATSAFAGTKALEEIRFKEGTIGVAIAFNSCTKLSAESYHSIIKGCSKTAAFTLTLPPETTVRSVYDAMYGSGAWDTITAEYGNLTIAYT